ncbi:MAG: ribosome recycling factor [Candidatus Nealsonbacteria bacterium]
MELYKEIIDKTKPEFEKAIKFFEEELAKLRTSRANPSLVEDVVVDCFGQKFALKQLAALSTPDPRQILIQPWDKSYIEGIVAALSRTGVGASPIVDKDTVRINLPSLTEEYRKDLARLVSEKQEQTRQVLRKWREDAWRQIQDGFKEGKVREDDKFRAKDELQKMIDDYQKRIDASGEKKKKEIAS